MKYYLLKFNIVLVIIIFGTIYVITEKSNYSTKEISAEFIEISQPLFYKDNKVVIVQWKNKQEINLEGKTKNNIKNWALYYLSAIPDSLYGIQAKNYPGKILEITYKNNGSANIVAGKIKVEKIELVKKFNEKSFFF